nr:hypothetical protein CFP56_18486 [Quercus suber]
MTVLLSLEMSGIDSDILDSVDSHCGLSVLLSNATFSKPISKEENKFSLNIKHHVIGLTPRVFQDITRF